MVELGNVSPSSLSNFANKPRLRCQAKFCTYQYNHKSRVRTILRAHCCIADFIFSLLWKYSLHHASLWTGNPWNLQRANHYVTDLLPIHQLLLLRSTSFFVDLHLALTPKSIEYAVPTFWSKVSGKFQTNWRIRDSRKSPSFPSIYDTIQLSEFFWYSVFILAIIRLGFGVYSLVILFIFSSHRQLYSTLSDVSLKTLWQRMHVYFFFQDVKT